MVFEEEIYAEKDLKRGKKFGFLLVFRVKKAVLQFLITVIIVFLSFQLRKIERKGIKLRLLAVSSSGF